MAISFSRPDPSSPAAVGSAAFPVTRRGFDQGEVRDFLRMVAAELARLQERERFLESELRAMQTRGMSSPGRLDEETVTTLLGEEAARVLSTARDASLQIRERAEESATRLVKDAAEDASRIREAANVEAARIRADATTDAESELEMAKQQGREMVNEAREYREKVLTELSRRRDAAREQIDKLLHGRDRLINAFERARIASESVIGELTEAHDEPEFIVDLAPTTGPVPVVNPAHPSFSSGVKIFDREAEERRPEPSRPPGPTRMPTSPAVIDIPIDEPGDAHPVVGAVPPLREADEDTMATTANAEMIDDLVVEEDLLVVEDGATTVIEVSDSSVEVEIVETIVEILDPVDSSAASVEDHVVTDSNEPDDVTPSNVVSLFGRGRRPSEVPEIPVTEPVAEEQHVAEPIPEEPTVVPSVEDSSSPHEGHAMDAALDDIFAKLRASSTADVAKSASVATRAKPDVAPAEPTDAPITPTNSPAQQVERTTQGTSKPKKHEPVAVPEAVFAVRDELVARLAPTIARRMKRVLADEQNSVLEHLRAKKSSLECDALLGVVDEQCVRYASAITAEVMVVAGAGAKAAKGSTRRVTVDDLTFAMMAAIRRAIVEPFRGDICTILEGSTDRSELAEQVRDVYRSWKSDRIDAVVDDIVREAHSHGVLKSLEPGVMVAWVVAPGGCCSDCEDNSLAGAQGSGVEFPAGHMFAPAHAGCRCQVWPIRN